MFKPQTKFEVSMITYNEDIKGNAKCRNSGFQPPRDSGVTHKIHLWLDWNRIVDFMIIEPFSQALTAEAF